MRCKPLHEGLLRGEVVGLAGSDVLYADDMRLRETRQEVVSLDVTRPMFIGWREIQYLLQSLEDGTKAESNHALP